jgi:hypothetical protein
MTRSLRLGCARALPGRRFGRNLIGAASGLTVMQMRRSAWEQVGRVSQNLLEAVEHMRIQRQDRAQAVGRGGPVEQRELAQLRRTLVDRRA